MRKTERQNQGVHYRRPLDRDCHHLRFCWPDPQLSCAPHTLPSATYIPSKLLRIPLFNLSSAKKFPILLCKAVKPLTSSMFYSNRSSFLLCSLVALGWICDCAPTLSSFNNFTSFTRLTICTGSFFTRFTIFCPLFSPGSLLPQGYYH